MYVLDNDGNHVYMDRMDGQGYLNIITADMKARTALTQRGPSKVVINQVRQIRIRSCSGFSWACSRTPAACRCVINKQMIGVIGIGGSAPRVPVWSDEICGHKAMQQVLGAADVAPLVEDLPNPQNAQLPRTPRRFRVSRPRRRRRRRVSNPEWVVGGKGAANVFDGNQISLAAAKKIARGVPRLRGGARAAACRSTSSTLSASSCTWSGWTDRCSTTSAPR